MAVFEIYIPKSGDFRVLLKFNNSVEFISKALTSRVECLQMIRFIRKNCHKDFAYIKKNLNCGSWCFELSQADEQGVLGRSTTYIDEPTVLNRISEMKMLAPKAKFESKLLIIN